MDGPRAALPAVVLAALEDGPAHGYRIARWVEERSTGDLALKEGSLYPVLRALEAQGLVVAVWEAQGERRRRVYQLTDDGRRALTSEREAWQRYRAAVERVLFDGGPAHATV